MRNKRNCGNCKYWDKKTKVCMSPFTFTKLKTNKNDFCKHFSEKKKGKD